MPGYGFSTPLRKTGVNFWRTSGLWVKLMEELGYPRFAAHGADWGALITADLGHRYPSRVMGVHFTMMLPLDLFSGGTPAPEDYDADEAPIATGLQNFFATESAYSALQSTKPQMTAVALNEIARTDSRSGQPMSGRSPERRYQRPIFMASSHSGADGALNDLGWSIITVSPTCTAV